MKPKEVFGDPKTQQSTEFYHPTTPEGESLGWNGAPPNLESGSPEHEGTERQRHDLYRIGWERIFEKEHYNGDSGSLDC